jgi:ATP-binding cassette subfamily C protein CydC
MTAGALLSLVAYAAAVGLLALSGWFIAAAAFAGLTPLSAQLFNFFYPSIGVRLFAVTRTLARYTERVVCHDATFRILTTLRNWFFQRLIPLVPARLMGYRRGDLLSRIVSDIDALDNLYLRVLAPAAVALVLIAGLTIGLWLVDVRIALCTMVFLLLTGFGLPLFGLGRHRRWGRELSVCLANLRSLVVEYLQGLSDLLILGASRSYLAKIAAADEGLLRCQQRMQAISAVLAALVTLLAGLAMTAALFLALGRVEAGALDGPFLALVALAVLGAFEAVAPLPQAFQYWGQTREAARRLLEFVNQSPPVSFRRHSPRLGDAVDLSFENVSFRYDTQEPWAIEQIDLKLDAGQRLAVVGATGAGKSTLAHLLVRFWDPNAGVIRADGTDIRELSEERLRQIFTVVSQQSHLFNGTIRSNLLLAQPAATEAQLDGALQAAQLDRFVAELPDGLDTWIGEGGMLLSGGQARRLIVAQAILRQAPVWILDEPTEGLDPGTGDALMTSLLEHSAGRSVLLITHHLHHLDGFDQVLELADGKIVFQGVPSDQSYHRFGEGGTYD